MVDGGASTCTATANAGFVFSGWSGDCNGATCNLAAVTSPMAVTANFTAQAQAVSIPTLSQWGLIVMSCLVAMLGIACVQRRS
ncbi:IPTL-CTERM sorting domain-containing protein [Acidovorax sp. SDU_ACID1]|uniref:IPTL-CTERM sorting domain-containing protein n=1 Tax=Acidovorax sp. SDU_ACID1 TaxID=3136632 RepID=UPI003873277B